MYGKINLHVNDFYGEDIYQGDGHGLFLAIDEVSIDIE